MTERHLSEQFDSATIPQGGRFDATNISEAVRPVFEMIRSIARRVMVDLWEAGDTPYSPDQAYFDYIDNGEINAHAIYIDGNFFVGINVGTVLGIYDACLALMSHPRVLPHIGDASAEVDQFKQLTIASLAAGPISTFDMDRAIGTRIFRYLPRDDKRSEFAILMASHALTQIVYHEFGHGFLGHLKYIRKEGGVARLAEFGVERTRSITADELEVLEFDADMLAATAIAAKLESNLAYPTSTANTVGRDESYYVAAFAIGVLFGLLNQHGGPIDSAIVRSHPDPDVRLTESAICLLAKSGQEAVASGQIHPALRARIDVRDVWQLLGISGPERDSDDWAEANKIRKRLYARFEETRRNLRAMW